ncbi:formimidoylglutamase [Aquimarina sp. BL5]|uniref:formimidoylglutamase n=1 Tax=Aquimarina sp. BL5 TaxID=1714860 RepID=UPI000E48F3E3|nr:formimidoylglutamase [Aquimarina sp. BL5]AXT49363.1 formimidoylglutamase [Aquimarina sp. BL5]RKM98428.1 formimidoylglutamase [Aquimarina sp. BL5]
MSDYKKTDTNIWAGRTSDDQLYLHEKITCIDLENDELPENQNTAFAIVGYACDEGVRRNSGRAGAALAPDIIRKMMSSLSNHLDDKVQIIDAGNIFCNENDLEKTQSYTLNRISELLNKKYFTIIFGGGHDLAYSHYNGIKKYKPNTTIGIINLDAHFDLRKIKNEGNSGTPFYQIAKENDRFKYLCLGIQEESNNKELFETANELKAQYIKNTDFTFENKDHVVVIINNFIASVDNIYLTIDLDGFSSIYAPGVSAPSPFGFSLDIAMTVIEKICKSGKLISADIVELNPKYDIDNCTARLGARLAYFIMKFISSH